MIETVLPVAVVIASVTLTYLICIRPMRRGHCAMTPNSRATVVDADEESEVRRLRAEIESLRGSGPL